MYASVIAVCVSRVCVCACVCVCVYVCVCVSVCVSENPGGDCAIAFNKSINNHLKCLSFFLLIYLLSNSVVSTIIHQRTEDLETKKRTRKNSLVLVMVTIFVCEEWRN